MPLPNKAQQNRIADAALKALTILGRPSTIESIYSVIRRHSLYRFNTPVEIHVLAQTIKRHAVNSRRSDRVRYQVIFSCEDGEWSRGSKISIHQSYVDLLKTKSQAFGDLEPRLDSGAEIANVINPQHTSSGIRASSADRKAIEIQAMRVAYDWMGANGFSGIKDCSANCPFDYQASRDGRLWKVEVKGTTARSADAFLMTSNEVSLHEAEKGATILIVVYAIQIVPKSQPRSASGGIVSADIGWDISTWSLEPKAYRVSRN
jgi:hypothetical protein